jgi:hypothetical protein
MIVSISESAVRGSLERSRDDRVYIRHNTPATITTTALHHYPGRNSCYLPTLPVTLPRMHAWQVVKLLGARRAWKLFKLSRFAKSLDVESLQELRAEAIKAWENGGREAVYALYEKGVLYIADWLEAQTNRGGTGKDRPVTVDATATEIKTEPQPRPDVAGPTTATRLSQLREDLSGVA